MIVENLANYRIVDLSKAIDPANSTRLCKVDRFFQESSKDYHSNLVVESHLGTHIETPYHYNSNWKDILELPITAFMGCAIVLQLECEPRTPITKSMLNKADKSRVCEGDIVILTSPYHCEPFSDNPNDTRPYLCKESGEWFIEKKVKCIGLGDSAAIEHSVKDACDVHEAVMPYDIMFLEVLQNLD